MIYITKFDKRIYIMSDNVVRVIHWPVYIKHLKPILGQESVHRRALYKISYKLSKWRKPQKPN